jgi:CRP-like cAMP-binding protein
MGTSAQALSAAVLAILRKTEPFPMLGEQGLARIATGARVVSIKAERTIVGQGLSWPYVAIVETGFVQAVMTDPNGREYALFDVAPGGVIADLALIDEGTTALRFIAAVEATRVILLLREAVREASSASPELGIALSRLAAKNMRRVLDRFAETVARPATFRVWSVLLKYATQTNESGSAHPLLSQMTQAQIAREAGTVREVVQRTLNALESAGILRRERGRIVQVDHRTLASRCADELRE